jgi:sarcosine oxidase
MSAENNEYDVIVIGVGSMGSATCSHISDRGYRVLGLEQFNVVHELGSHAGQSRIIRKAYFEHPDYVPLLQRAYENWKQIEVQTNLEIYHKTGIVYFGTPDNPTMAGIRNAARLYDLPVQKLSTTEGKTKYPYFKPSPDFEILLEEDAGFVTPEKAIRAYAENAIRNGVVIRTNENVLHWQRINDKVQVTTATARYTAQKLVITAGSWTSKLIPEFQSTLKVTRQMLAWIQPDNPDAFVLGNFPCWFIEDPDLGLFYGFPMLAEKKFGPPGGLKLAHHYPGEKADPDHRQTDIPAGTEENIRYILRKYIPDAGEKIAVLKECLYTYSPDTNFIIDHFDNDKRVTIACGFSGHGFKFASVIGEILADLALKGSTDLPIDFLRLKRLQTAS